MSDAAGRRYRRRTRRLVGLMLLVWLAFGFGIHLLVNQLNAVVILGIPLGFYMAAQGALIAFSIMLFAFARRHERIEREAGTSADA